MKNSEGITWMHREVVHEIPEEIKNLPQWEKWLEAMLKAPSWKKAEYGAQSVAWLGETPELWCIQALARNGEMS